VRRVTTIAAAMLVGGCSLIWGPDTDLIEPFDGGPMDGGTRDGGEDGGDGGDPPLDGCTPMGEETGETACTDGLDNDCDGLPDCLDDECGGVTACCRMRDDVETREVTCNDDVDNDCDGLADCDDSDCASDGVCCDLVMGSTWGDLTTDYNFWDAHGAAIPSVNEVEFAPGAVGQVVNRTCAPLAFGMRLEADFRTTSFGDPDDYAAVLLAPVDTPRGGGDMTLLADLAVRVTRDNGVVLERAGTVLARTMAMSITGATVQIDLQPSVDAASRPVLVMSVLVTPSGGTPERLATDEVLMPLSDLRGDDAGCTPDGLYLAFEGRGSGVVVDDMVSARTGNCPNPTQFLQDQGGPLGEAGILEPGSWRMGGAGEPALLTTGSPETNRIDLLVDAAEDERSDEIFRFIDFSIGGSIRGAAWQQRSSGPGGPPNLIGPDPSAREPTQVLPRGVSGRVIAWAQPHRMTEDYEIQWGELGGSATAASTVQGVLLMPGDNAGTMVECDSLRDPALVALDAEGAPADRPNLLLLFTCVKAAENDTIGVARFDYDMVGSAYELMEVDETLFDGSIGGYASRGYFSPEVAVVAIDDTIGDDMARYALRLWFLVRDGAGRVRVAHAFGDVTTGELPQIVPYPGNPVLDPEAASLGGSCALGCTIESLSVAATEGRSNLWAPPVDASYLFLIERSVFRTDGVDHELVPLRQPRPAGG